MAAHEHIFWPPSTVLPDLGDREVLRDHAYQMGSQPQATRYRLLGRRDDRRVCSDRAGRESLSQQFNVPGREGFEANQQIAAIYGSGGDVAPLVPVVQLPKGTTVDSPGVRERTRGSARACGSALPAARIASYASTGDRSFVSADGRTTYALVDIPARGRCRPGPAGSTAGAEGARRCHGRRRKRAGHRARRTPRNRQRHRWHRNRRASRDAPGCTRRAAGARSSSSARSPHSSRC